MARITKGPNAAALYGGSTLVDRMTVQDGHLIVYSGPGGKERMQRRAAGGSPPAWRPEIQAALEAGQGKAGLVYADLVALWLPFAKASQLSGGDMSTLLAQQPELLKKRLPLLATFEPAAGLDATVRMPLETFALLGLLLSR